MAASPEKSEEGVPLSAVDRMDGQDPDRVFHGFINKFA